MPRLPRWLRLCGAIVAFLLLLAAIIVLAPLYRSLPATAGSDTIATLENVVAVQRDALGVVTIQGTSRRDVARAMGFVHAQERFFQMDLMRRLAAGELSELFGPVALPTDRRHRLHRLRAVARLALEKLPPEHRELLDDYTFGINTGLEKLGEVPFEYLLLRTKPAKWLAEDSMLVIGAMALGLQDVGGQPDRARGTIRDVFTPEVADFFLSGADAFEAPLDGTKIPLPPLPEKPALRAGVAAAASPNFSREPAAALAATPAARLFAAWLPGRLSDPDTSSGSNAWAIAGPHTAGLSTILASDVHLGLSVPNVWFRMQLKWIGVDQRVRIITGASLPGAPALVLGDNGAVAWAVTNAYIDVSDVVVVETDPQNANRYRTPDGWKEFAPIAESIAVKGATGPTEEVLRGQQTIWGPVIGHDAAGRPLAFRWVMHEPDAYNLQFLSLEEVASVRGAIAFAKVSGVPQQNFVCADRHGDIAWTIAGRIPRRVGTDGRTPASWADGTVRWDGWLPATEYPYVVNPPAGRIWSANARMVGGAELAKLGDGGYALGSRAIEIQEALLAKDQFTAEDARQLQLDTRGRYLERWQQLLLATLSTEALNGDGARAELLRLAGQWGGRAVPDSAGYALVREFRKRALQRIRTAVFAPCLAYDRDFSVLASGDDESFLQLEEPLYALASRQPVGWLPDGRAGWTKLLLAAVDETIAHAGGAGKLAAFTWGSQNRLEMRHPLSGGIPVLGSWLNQKRAPLSGDHNVVNALTSNHGPSERMVVMPGREDESFFQMPGGQSGNPLSSHYRDSLEAWLKGEASPFLPGRVEDHLILNPIGGGS